MPTRRAFLIGGAATVAVGAGTALGVERGTLPGRPLAQALLGLNGPDGVPPDVRPGPVEAGSLVSRHRPGTTQWRLVLPPGEHRHLPVVVALHGLGGSAAKLAGPAYALDRYLAGAVADGVPPFAIAAVDGGTSYWHPRPDGEDASAVVTDDLLPMLADRGLDVARLGLIGWSMGGYGALRLAALLGPSRVAAVVACSPAMWDDPDDASPAGFADAEEYLRFRVQGHQADLAGIPVRIDCGTGDPFYRAVQHYVDGFPDGQAPVATFPPGAHTDGFWRRMLPPQLAFLGRHLT